MRGWCGPAGPLAKQLVLSPTPGAGRPPPISRKHKAATCADAPAPTHPAPTHPAPTHPAPTQYIVDDMLQLLCSFRTSLVNADGKLGLRGPTSQMNAVNFDAYWPYNFLSLRPTYKVSDWDVARPIMDEYLAKTREERGPMFCGWNICGDTLFTSESFHNAGAVAEHLENVQPLVDKLLSSGAATLERMELHGPTSELAKCKGAIKGSVDAAFFEIDSGCTFLVRPYAGMSRGHAHFSIAPYFKVSDWATAQPLLDECVEKMRRTAGCVFFGWTKSGDDTLFCNCAFTNADGLRAHLASVDSIVVALLDGPATLESVSVHGPKTRLLEVKDATDSYHGLAPDYFAIESGFQRYEVTVGLPQNPLGMLDYGK